MNQHISKTFLRIFNLSIKSKLIFLEIKLTLPKYRDALQCVYKKNSKYIRGLHIANKNRFKYNYSLNTKIDFSNKNN